MELEETSLLFKAGKHAYTSRSELTELAEMGLGFPWTEVVALNWVQHRTCATPLPGTVPKRAGSCPPKAHPFTLGVFACFTCAHISLQLLSMNPYPRSTLARLPHTQTLAVLPFVMIMGLLPSLAPSHFQGFRQSRQQHLPMVCVLKAPQAGAGTSIGHIWKGHNTKKAESANPQSWPLSWPELS